MAQKRQRREFEEDLRREQAPYVLYGTPLPSFDENTRDDGSYVPVWKQEVRDEQGRKRLHGAFTGGFSAGYFNSVGSKEGWTPSTFVSSRSDRAKTAKNARQQRVEDFMDEEDIREREESRQISTTSGFSGFGTQDDPSAQNTLEELFKPADNTMGEQLLTRMGWKKGQGIGPRVLKRIDASDPTSEMLEFPPEDTSIPDFEPMNGTKGLGCNGEKSLVPGSSQSRSTDRLGYIDPTYAVAKKSATMGIGVGALNDTGSDEEDPYELGPKMAHGKILGKDKKSKKKQHSSLGVGVGQSKIKSAIVSKKLPSLAVTLRKCHDGKLPLAGFLLASEIDAFQAISLSREKYEPPEVPEDWQPTKAISVTPQDPATTVRNTSTSSFVLSSQTAQSRAQLLGETQLQGKSVFDYLSPTARDRLVTVTGNDKLPPGLGQTPHANAHEGSPDSSSGRQLQIPYLDPATALNGLTRLKKDKNPPYSDDLLKQGRYKDFLRYSSNPSAASRIPPLRAPHHKADEDHLAELHEFAATGSLFKPAAGMLASRFVSASSGEVAATSKAGDDSVTVGTEHDPSTAELITQPVRQKVTDPAEEAARMGMFGIATRCTISFSPTRLVCKRFGVEMNYL